MKKLLTLLSIVLFSFTAFSQHSIITVFSDDGEKFSLYVNGEKINNTPQTRVADVKITSEMSNLKIEFVNSSIPAIKKNVMLKDVDGNYQKMVFIIKIDKKGEYKLRMNSFEAYTPEEESEVDYNDYAQESGETVTTTISVSGTDESVSSTEHASISMNINADENNASLNVEVNNSNEMSSEESVDISMNVSGVTTTTTTTTYTESYSTESTEENYTSSDRCVYATSNADFSKIKSSINSMDFEDSKLTTAKNIAKNKCLTSSQVHDIMKLFTYEDNRLEFAVYAYDFVFDKDNYYEVYSAFEYELTIDELNKKLGL